MLIPRFSIKSMLAITVGFAVLFLVARQVAEGRYWATSVMTFFGLSVILFGIFAVMFSLAYFFSLLGRESGKQVRKPQSPFAADRLPPQVIPPREID